MLRNRHGQNAIEYILLVIVVILVIVAALSPSGFFTQAVDQSLNAGVYAVENMVNGVWP